MMGWSASVRKRAGSASSSLLFMIRPVPMATDPDERRAKTIAQIGYKYDIGCDF
jgi:hypothetical protein